MSTMKLGPHIIISSAPAMAWATRAPIVKALNDTAPLIAAQPNAWRIWRQSYANEGDTSDPVGTVNLSINALKGYNHPRLIVQIWTGAHPTRAQLTVAVDHCHALGYLTCGSSHFTGDYKQADWDDDEAAGVDFHGPQCYWGNQGFTLDNALRYRQFWKPGNKPVVIPECGRDEIEGGGHGWQNSNISAQSYLAELLSYNDAISPDSYVIGATPFTAGPTPDWQPFSTDSFSDQIPGGAIVPTPFPNPTGGDLSFFWTWQRDRIANGEDPRDIAAFLAHLRGVGKDPNNPHIQGLPFFTSVLPNA